MAQAEESETTTDTCVALLNYDWDKLPFKDDSEKEKAQNFATYLAKEKGLNKNSLKPFEMATFLLGNNYDNELAAY